MQTKHVNRFIGIVALGIVALGVGALGAISATAHAQNSTLAQKLDIIEQGLLQCSYYKSVEIVRDDAAEPTRIVLNLIDEDGTKMITPLHDIDRARKTHYSYEGHDAEVVSLRCRKGAGNCIHFRWEGSTGAAKIRTASVYFPQGYDGCGDDNYRNVATNFELLLREHLLQ
ncbi:MAG: hypothetical protein ACR2P7_07970 [bacterium]